MSEAAVMPPRATPEEFAVELHRRFQSVDKVDPASLADLFQYAGADDKNSTALRNVLHQYLLHRTISHAVRHTAYYKSDEAYADWRPTTDDRPPRTDSLPVLNRATVIERFDDFLADDVSLRSICHTSGTTGPALNVYKSHEEIGFIQAYFRRLFQPLAQALPSKPLLLTFPNLYHGVLVPLPSIGMTFSGGVTDDALIRDARRVLESRFRIKGHDNRISLLSGLGHHILLFTNYLIEQEIDPRDYKLNGVTVTGGFQGRHWLRYLSSAWGCVVNDRFTMTEVVGGASRIWNTDIFQLDPHILGEVVDYDSLRVIDQSVGLLVITNFHPFVQMQPLIRYTLGDLVRRLPGPGPLQFQFLGKESNCISWLRDGRREWLVFSAVLYELLQPYPDVNVFEWFSNVRTVHDRTIGSHPIMLVSHKIDGGRLSIQIQIELRYAPHNWPERVGELRRAVIEGLRSTPDTVLAERMDAGDVVVKLEFKPPGALYVPRVNKI
jgi:phenylacetate-coenzyme A ligase PaaK-like adenylate-forming protein